MEVTILSYSLGAVVAGDLVKAAMLDNCVSLFEGSGEGAVRRVPEGGGACSGRQVHRHLEAGWEQRRYGSKAYPNFLGDHREKLP